MIWHVIVHVGEDDQYAPSIDLNSPRIHVAFDRSGDAWSVTNDVLRQLQFLPSFTEEHPSIDLAYLALSVYAADLRIPRRFAQDRWSRDIEIHLPVQNIELWTQSAKCVEQTLNFLTGDHWTICFRQGTRRREPVDIKPIRAIDAVCLFSGGLDSLIGALDLLADNRNVALVGHHGSGITNPIQNRVIEAVRKKYDSNIAPFMFYAQPPKKRIQGEETMRSRSFLFFSVGVAVSAAIGGNLPLVIAENGFISLNVPLTHARTGSRSTRTTHPHYMDLYTKMLGKLGLSIAIEMPYKFKTKGEMLEECRDHELLATTAPLSMSCSHPEAGRYRGHSPNQHCGYCVPCIIRRAAMKAARLDDAAYSNYVERPTPTITGNAGGDLMAFRMALERGREMNKTQAVFRILSSGPIPSLEIDNYAAMFLRGLKEVGNLLEMRNMS